MTIFSFIFSRQSHKNSRGYYLNHDSLMPRTRIFNVVKPEYRHKVIFYFIAEQTPEKLTDEDRTLYDDER